MISSWLTFELLLRGEDGRLAADGERPFSGDLIDGDPLQTAIRKMRLVQHHGWPDAKLHLKDKRGKALIDRADNKSPDIWILKCKPSCWRLYFWVQPAESRIVYLYAVCKKKQARAQDDSIKARNRLGLIGSGAGSFGIANFQFPS